MLKIGPSGNSLSFYAEGHTRTKEAAGWIAERGLNAFEYSFGRGVNIKEESAAEIGAEFARYGVEISAHAPYYTNFANPDDDMIEKSFGYMVYFFEMACAVSGYLLGVNPFNQPGVESYKKNMFALLGKPGYEDQRAALEEKLAD